MGSKLDTVCSSVLWNSIVVQIQKSIGNWTDALLICWQWEKSRITGYRPFFPIWYMSFSLSPWILSVHMQVRLWCQLCSHINGVFTSSLKNLLEQKTPHWWGWIFPPPHFIESLPLFPLSISLNPTFIVFDFFQIISFRLPLLIFKPPSLSQWSSPPLSHGSVFLSLLHSLPLNAHSIDVFLSIVAPVMLFLFLAFHFVSNLLFVKWFSVVLSPQVCSLPCTQMYR